MTDAAGFEAVVADVWLPLQRYLRRRADPVMAEDVLGDVLLVMWRRRDDLPVDAALPWCYAIARRCLANARRGEERHLRLVHRLADEPLGPEPSDDPALDAALTLRSPADRELLRLWAWEGLSPREIATVLDITANAASVRLHRALGRLRKDLGKNGAGGGHALGWQGEEASD